MHTRRVVCGVVLALIGAVSLGFLSGCATEVTVNTIDQPLSVREARATLMKLREPSCGKQRMYWAPAESAYRDINEVSVHSDAFVLNDKWRFEFVTLPAPVIFRGGQTGQVILSVRPQSGSIWVGGCSHDEELAHRLANAILVLKHAASPEARAQADTDFTRVAETYRQASVKPVPGEDIRRFQIQAETVVRSKRFQDAADLYEDALTVAPWWPAGHFNRALVLSEIGDFKAAVREMKRYLSLVPDAPNARAAQDKIYDWEGRMQR